MNYRLRNKLKSIVLSEEEQNKLQNEIHFASGLFPINKTRPEDVFIVGFPKSGNTLMQHIVTHLVYGVNENVTSSIVLSFVPDIYASTHYFRFSDVCFFKSHERPKINYKKVIYLLRDGRESLLSYYHMIKNMGGDIAIEDLYDGKIDIYGGAWHEHVNEWETNPYSAEIIFVKYEDLIANKMDVLHRLCLFLKIDRSQYELERVLKYTSFEFMKKLERKEDWTRMKKEVEFNKGNFVRKGAVDSFKEEVSSVYLNRFVKRSSNNFYDFL